MKLLFIIAVCLTVPAAAWSGNLLIEQNAVISDTKDFPRAKLIALSKPGADMIRASGWRCDSLSAIRPWMFKRGFTMVCNNFNYEYEFEDRGGRWTVSLK